MATRTEFPATKPARYLLSTPPTPCKLRSMPRLAWINGEVVPLEQAKVRAFDHAHLYGDGLFEGIRIYHGQVFKLDEHLERLFHGIRYLGFNMTMTVEELRGHLLATCALAAFESGYIRLNVTRGTGLGLDPKNIDSEPNIVIAVSSLALYPPEAYTQGLDVITSSFRVFPPDALDPRVKCIGRYAANILAKQEANRAGAGEALMLNGQGQIAEATGDNVFLIQGGVVRTPHASSGILLGVTRNTVLHLAREAGYHVEETFLTPFDVACADEAFLTGTAAEVIPMVTLDAKPIGSGVPGPITADLIERFRAETRNGTPFC